MDAMGHVNNAKYLTYIETARVNYFRDVLSLQVEGTQHSVILAKATVDFRVPIMMGDEVTVYTRCNRIGNKSFDLEYEMVRTGKVEPEIVGLAHTVLVAFDYEQQATIAVLDKWKKAIEEFEA